MKLSDRTIKIIEEIIQISPRTGIETLFVAAEAKTGDAICKNDKESEFIIQKLLQIPNIKPINQTEILYYYNEKLADKKLIDYLTNYNEETYNKEIEMARTITYPEGYKHIEYYMGLLYGYPECCINAYIDNKNIQKFMPYTEHLWCNNECKESKKIQEKAIQAVLINAPKHQLIASQLGELTI